MSTLEAIFKKEEISYVLAYRGGKPYDESYVGGWSFLVVKADGEVFGSGRNSLIENDDMFYDDLPMKEGGIARGEFERVDMLGGLKVRKVVVGLNFVVALTSDNTLLKWGLMCAAEQVCFVRKYTAGPCHCGRTYLGSNYSAGGVNLLMCTHISPSFKTYTLENPPPSGVPCVYLVKHNTNPIVCSKCNRKCTTSKVDSSAVNYCSNCNLYAEAVRVKSPHQLDTRIIDVDAGKTFTCSLTEEYKVKVHYQHNSGTIICQLPAGEIPESLSCGAEHIALITKAGNLYSYGAIKGEDTLATGKIGSITLMNVFTPKRAVKVHCWKNFTACLLDDGTVYEFGKSPSSYVDAVWSDNCSIKPVMECLENSYTGWSAICLMILGKELKALMNDDESDSGKILQVSIKLDPEETPAECSTQTTPAQTSSLHPKLTTLYGNKRFSDLTLKLADEDFPAHKVILMTTSEYFHNIFNEDSAATTLDMTSYNPRAYRCLLQHFYQLPPNDLPVDDLLDLLQIAASYGEKKIVEFVSESLKDCLTIENVGQILSKAKSLAIHDLTEACKDFIRSPAYKEHIAETLIENLSIHI